MCVRAGERRLPLQREYTCAHRTSAGIVTLAAPASDTRTHSFGWPGSRCAYGRAMRSDARREPTAVRMQPDGSPPTVIEETR